MQPVEVGSRLSWLQAQSSIPIEFHGHKVFGLALANHLAAVKAGIHWHSDTAVSGPAMQMGGQHWLGLNEKQQGNEIHAQSLVATHHAEASVDAALQRATKAARVP